MSVTESKTVYYEGATFFGGRLAWGLWWLPGCFRCNARFHLEDGELVIEDMNRAGDEVVASRRYALASVQKIALFDTQDTWCCRILFADQGWVEICSLVRREKRWHEAYPAFHDFALELHQALARQKIAAQCWRGHRGMRFLGWAVLAGAVCMGGRLAFYRLDTNIMTVDSSLSEGIAWACTAAFLALGFRFVRVGGNGQPKLGAYELTTPPLK